MKKRLEALRKMRNAVVKDRLVSEGDCGCDDHQRDIRTRFSKMGGAKKPIGRLAKKPGKIQEQRFQPEMDPSTRLPHQYPPGFDEWMADVKEAVEEFTGMSLDILPVLPWDKWFQQGMSPIKAARSAIRKAEEEDDTFDASRYMDDELGEEAPRRPLRRRMGGSKLGSRDRSLSGALGQLAAFLEDFDLSSGIEDDEEDEFEEEAPAPGPKKQVRKQSPPRKKSAFEKFVEQNRAEAAGAMAAVIEDGQRQTAKAAEKDKKPLMSRDVAKTVASIEQGDMGMKELARRPKARSEVAEAVAAVANDAQKTAAGTALPFMDQVAMSKIANQEIIEEHDDEDV